jgi:hypothetical protein
MKQSLTCLALAWLLISCKQQARIVNESFIDSLITHYTLPVIAKSNETEMQFWQNRMETQPPGIVNEQKYANTLLMRFTLFGDIQDLKKADSILSCADEHFKRTETGLSLTLAAYSLMQHRFGKAKAYVQHASELGGKRNALLSGAFDVNLELGQYDSAATVLQQLRPNADYGYYFRLSKLKHLEGSIDSAALNMLRAAELAGSNDYLKQIALSNAADLYIHAGRLKEANDLYTQCIHLNPADFHSVMGLGWIALTHDRNDSLAERIFRFAEAQLKLPDPLLKLSQMAEEKGDSLLQKKYADGFAVKATDPAYGNMYNKYLIDLYTGILHDPAKAEAIAEKETTNRATPQTYAWYVWSLFNNHKPDKAYQIYQDHVSGKPLEALELFWMGKLMKGLSKGYNAQQFFEAANQNRYDLSPAKMKDLEENLE